MIAPTVEELSKEYAGKVKVGKLNTDENPDIASKYKIMGIPTIMFFKDGQKVDQIVGAVPKPQLKAKIDALLQG
jgi:thioredoxin 1